MNIFVIFGTQRTGGTALLDALNKHPSVECHRELFMPRTTEELCFTKYRRTLTRSARWLHPLATRTEYLDQMLVKPATPAVRGFKLTYNQLAAGNIASSVAYRVPRATMTLRDRGLVRWMHGEDVRIVHTLRANLLKIIVSEDRAKARGIYHAKESSLRLDQITLQTRGLVRRLRELDATVRQMRGLASEFRAVEVEYGDFLATPEVVLERICTFLGVEPRRGMQSDFTKVTDDNLEKVLVNYEEVAVCLASTQFRAMLPK